MKITHHTTMYTMTILPIGRTAGVLTVTGKRKKAV